MKVATGIDWLRYTAPYGTNLDVILPLGVTLGHAVEPLGHYNTAYELVPDGRIDWNSANPKEGMGVLFTGAQLRTVEAYGISGEDMLCQVAGKTTCKLTRLDFAVDIWDAGASPDDVLAAFQQGQAVTRAKKAEQYHGWDKEAQRNGNTVYVGGRTSETYVRVYSKNLETINKTGLRNGKQTAEKQQLIEMLQALDYTRVEIELKAGKANAVAKAVPEHGVAAVAATAINAYLKLPTIEWWNEMLKFLPLCDEKLLEGKNHNKPKSDRWLMEQALPAVLRAIYAEKEAVIAAVQAALTELDTKGH